MHAIEELPDEMDNFQDMKRSPLKWPRRGFLIEANSSHEAAVEDLGGGGGDSGPCSHCAERAARCCGVVRASHLEYVVK